MELFIRRRWPMPWNGMPDSREECTLQTTPSTRFPCRHPTHVTAFSIPFWILISGVFPPIARLLLLLPSSPRFAHRPVPLLNLAVSGIFSAIIALLFDLEKLVEFMSIGTLLAYTIVSASVIILRYKPEQQEQEIKDGGGGDDASLSTASVQSENLFLPHQAGKLKHEFWWLADLIGGYSHGEVIPLVVALFTCGSVALWILINFLGNSVFYAEWTIIVFLSFLILVVLLCLFIIGAHRQNPSTDTFRVPWVPLVPGLSILCNVGLMVHLNALTWVRFAVWMILGLLVYFLYGIKHSKESDQIKTYSMLITSTEAHKENWGAIKPSGDAIETKVIKEQGGAEVTKENFPSSKKNEQDFST